MVRIVNGDLLCATEEYICQQNNCIAVKPHGLSESIRRSLGVDPYSIRRSLNGRNYAVPEDQSIPGTIQIYTSNNTKNKIICMYAQYGMSKPYRYNTSNNFRGKYNDSYTVDSYESRLIWFYKCLYEISKLKPVSLSFPYNIGCGLAGGNWNRDYYPAIMYFSEKFPDIDIVLYKLD